MPAEVRGETLTSSLPQRPTGSLGVLVGEEHMVAVGAKSSARNCLALGARLQNKVFRAFVSRGGQYREMEVNCS